MNSRNYKGLPYSIYDQKTTTVDVSLFTNTRYMSTKRIYQVAIGYVGGSKGDTGSVQLKINGVLGNYTWEYYHGYGLVSVNIPLTNGMNPIISLEIVGDNDYTFKHLNGSETDTEYWYETPPINVHAGSVSVLGSKNLAESITFTANTQGWGMLLEGGFGTICSSTNTLVMQPNEDNKSKTKVDLDVRAFSIEDWDWVHNGFYNAEVLAGHISLDGFYWKGAEIVSFAVNNKSIEQDTLVSWSCANQEKWHLQVVKDEVVLHDIEQNNNLQAYTIPKSVINSVGIYTIKLQTKKIGNIALSDWATKTIEFTITEPTITNLTQIGEYYEENIIINWRSEYQDGFEYELYQNNVKIKSDIGSTDKKFLIQANTFTQTENCSVRVRIKHEYLGVVKYSDWREINLKLKIVVPTVNDLSLSGSNIDLKLVFSWISTHQQGYEVEIKKDEELVKSYNGSTGTNIEITPGTLATGLYKFRVRVAYKDRWTAWQEITVTLVETLPSIGVLEPDGVIVERDNSIRIWWTSTNQTKWKLIIDSINDYAGTTTKENILEPGALTTGQHSIELIVTYVTGAGIEKIVTKKAEFIVQGKPPIPTIISDNKFITNRPLFEWDTQDQQGFILDILDNNSKVIYSTDWENGLITQHKVLDYLTNGIYTVRIKVMNQYSLESDYGTQQITINAIEETEINLNTIALENSVLLSWDNINNVFTKFYILRNDTVIAKTTDDKYIDNTAFKECIYVVRGITATDVCKDSNKSFIECNIKHGIMATVDKLEDTICVGLSRDEFNFNGAIGLEATQIELSGRELPATIFGEHSTNTYTLTFVRNDFLRFVEMCRRRQTFLYRDSRQKLYLTINNPNYKIDCFGLEYSIEAIEVDFKEEVEYE